MPAFTPATQRLNNDIARMFRRIWRTIIRTSPVLLLGILGCSQEQPNGTTTKESPPQSGIAADQVGLTFVVPSGWKSEPQESGETESYSFHSDGLLGGLLMFSPWPPGGSTREMPDNVKTLAESFMNVSQDTPGVQLSSRGYDVEDLSGPKCIGSFALFELGGAATGSVQVMFMFSTDNRIWNGQFTGHSNMWAQALSILCSVNADHETPDLSKSSEMNEKPVLTKRTREIAAPEIPVHPQQSFLRGTWKHDDEIVLSVEESDSGVLVITRPSPEEWDLVVNNVRWEDDVLRFDTFSYFTGQIDMSAITPDGDHPFSGVRIESTLRLFIDEDGLELSAKTKDLEEPIVFALKRDSPKN